MANKVQIDFTANGAQFFRVAQSVKGEIESIKGALLSAVGIGAVTEMVSSAIDFAKEANKSSEELGVSLDRAMQLNHVMESIGKNSHDLANAMGKMQGYMTKAYGDASKMAELKKFGITQEDFENFNFDRVMRKALEASKTMSQTEAQIGFTRMFGRGMGIDLLYKREQLLEDPKASGLRKEQIKEIMELTAQFKELKEVVNVYVIKALLELADFVQGLFGKGTRSYYEKAADELAAEVAGERYNKGLGERSDIKRYTAEAAFQSSVTGIFFGTPEEKKKTFDEALKKYVERMAGDPAIAQAAWESFQKNRGLLPFEVTRQKMAEMEASGSRGPNIIEPTEKKPMSFSGIANPFLQIGGLMGINTNLRMIDLTEQIAQATKEAADHLNDINNKMGQDKAAPPPPVQPTLPSFSPGGGEFGGHGAGGSWEPIPPKSTQTQKVYTPQQLHMGGL